MVGWANSVHRHSPSRPQTRRAAVSLFVAREQALEPPPISHTNNGSGEAPPARKRGFSSYYKRTRRPAVARVQGEGRVERGRRGRARARDGEEGGPGGVYGHRVARTSKQDMFCTSLDTCKHTLMRFSEGTESPAHSFHANRTGAPSPSRASRLPNELAVYSRYSRLDSNQIVPVHSVCIERSVTCNRYSKFGRYRRWSLG